MLNRLTRTSTTRPTAAEEKAAHATLSRAADLFEAARNAENTRSLDAHFETLRAALDTLDQTAREQTRAIAENLDQLLSQMDDGPARVSTNTTPTERQLAKEKEKLKRAQSAAEGLHEQSHSAQISLSQKYDRWLDLLKKLRECEAHTQASTDVATDTALETRLSEFLDYAQAFLRSRRVKDRTEAAMQEALSGFALPSHFTEALHRPELIQAVDAALRNMLVRESLNPEDAKARQHAAATIAHMLAACNQPDRRGLYSHFASLLIGLAATVALYVLMRALQTHQDAMWLSAVREDATGWLFTAGNLDQNLKVWDRENTIDQSHIWPSYFEGTGQLFLKLREQALSVDDLREVLCNALQIRADATSEPYVPRLAVRPNVDQETLRNVQAHQNWYESLTDQFMNLYARLDQSEQQFPQAAASGFLGCEPEAKPAETSWSAPAHLLIGATAVVAIYSALRGARLEVQSRSARSACQPLARNIVEAYRTRDPAPTLAKAGQALHEHTTQPQLAKYLDTLESNEGTAQEVCGAVKAALDATREDLASRKQSTAQIRKLQEDLADANDALKRAQNELSSLEEKRESKQQQIAGIRNKVVALEDARRKEQSTTAVGADRMAQFLSLSGQLEDVEQQIKSQRAELLSRLNTLNEEYSAARGRAEASRHTWRQFDNGDAASQARAQTARYIGRNALNRSRERHVGLSATALESRIRNGQFESESGETVATGSVHQASSYFTHSHFHLALADAMRKASSAATPLDQPLRVSHDRTMGVHVSLNRRGEAEVREVAASEVRFGDTSGGQVRVEHIHPVP